MEDFFLLGGFVVIAILGYYMMAGLDRFLNQVRQDKEKREKTACLNIATSCLNAIPVVSDIVGDINCSYPNVHCNLSVGHEQEVIRSFTSGDADVAIISADTDVESGTPAQWKCITLKPRSFSMDDGIVKVKAVEKRPQPQKVLWKDCDDKSVVMHFIHCLCGQQT